MRCLDIYNQLKNPMDDDEVINQITETYENNRDIYSGLTRVVNKDYEFQISKEEKNKFYANIYNVWKNNILNFSNEKMQQFSEKSKEEIRILKNYLKSVPTIRTYDDVKKYFLDVSDLNLLNLFRLYGPIHDENIWHYFKSQRLDPFEGESSDNVSHRLYLNVEGVDLHFIANEFVNKCLSHNLPFYFKFDEESARDDDLVIYTDTKNLCSHISVLREIAKENKNVIARCKKPPILTGVIDGFIGYGSEPSLGAKGELRSYNLVRSKAIEDGIKKTTSEWLKVNYNNRKIKYDGMTVSVNEFLTFKVVESISNFVKGRLNSQSCPWTVEEITEPSFMFNIYNSVKANMNNYVANYIDSNVAREVLHLNISGKDYKFDDYRFNKAINKLIAGLLKNDDEFRKMAKKNILIVSDKDCIDAKRYCFDKGIYEMFEQEDKALDSINEVYEILVKGCLKFNLPIPRKKSDFESVSSYRKYIFDYSQKVSDIIKSRNIYPKCSLDNKKVVQDMPINSNFDQEICDKAVSLEETDSAKQLLKK